MKNEILDLLKETLVGDEEIDNSDVLYDLLDYSGRLHEIIDSHIDIYHYDLRVWAVENWEYYARRCVDGLFNEYNGVLFNREVAP